MGASRNEELLDKGLRDDNVHIAKLGKVEEQVPDLYIEEMVDDEVSNAKLVEVTHEEKEEDFGWRSLHVTFLYEIFQ